MKKIFKDLLLGIIIIAASIGIALTVFALTLAMDMVANLNNTCTEEEFNNYFDIEIVEEYDCNAICYDRNTGVMYYIRNYDLNNSYAIPIYNSDGSLKLYSGD